MKIMHVGTVLGLSLFFMLYLTACGDDPVSNNDQVKSLKSGDWTATSDFGGFDFTVNPEGTEIPNYTYRFDGWGCGGVTLSGSIIYTRTPGWPISDRKFTIEEDLDAQGNQAMTIQGTFSNSGDQVSGTFVGVMYGTTCQGNWSGSADE